MCLWAPTQHSNPAVMIRTEPIGRPLPTRPRGVTNESVRKVRGRRPTNARKEDERRKGKGGPVSIPELPKGRYPNVHQLAPRS